MVEDRAKRSSDDETLGIAKPNASCDNKVIIGDEIQPTKKNHIKWIY